ncbi:MAG: hypothetical protein ACKVVP_01190, partial [Chloroflexota bacterium]
DLCGRIFGGCGPDDLTPAEAHAAVTGWITAFMRRHVASDDRFEAWFETSGMPYVEVTSPKRPPRTP